MTKHKKECGKADRQNVLRVALASRAATFVLCLVFSLFPDFDTSNESYRQHNGGLTARLLGHFSNWDGVYFSWIAEHGYTYEHFHAFFPLYPLLVRVLSTALSLFFPGASFKSLVLVSGFFLSNTCFVLSALFLYDASLSVLKDAKLAYTASVIYCINPASVFMSSLYTESLFAALTFFGIRAFVRENTFVATLAFTAASATRSNGIIAAGFAIYAFMDKCSNICDAIFLRDKPKVDVAKVASSAFVTALQVIAIFVPYLAVQLYGNINYGYPATFNFYGNIQSKYWNQGFLKYFQVKQLPNFALAAPVFAVSFSAVAVYWLRNYKAKELTHLGFFSSDSIPFIGYLFAESAIALLFMHVQVATRFISSSSPALYWWLAHVSHQIPKLKTITLCYLLVYFVVGPLMFTNFYPWT